MSAFQERLQRLSPEKRELLELFVRKGRDAPPGVVEAPMPGNEQRLADIWAEVLDLETVGRKEDYFELGGDSILLIQIVARARQQGLLITVHDFFQDPTVAGLARAAERALAAAPPIDGPDPATPSGGPDDGPPEVEDVYPLTPMQEGMLFATLRAPDADTYRVQWSLQAEGAFDRQAFEHAWQTCLARHPVLRTAVRWVGRAEPAQVLLRSVRSAVRYEDWSDLPDEERARRIVAAEQEDLARGFDLASPPLMRISVFRTGPASHHLLWTHHHLILDGWSQEVLLGEMAAVYRAARCAQTPQLGPAPPYKEYVRWVRTQDLAEVEGFWKGELQGLGADAERRPAAGAADPGGPRVVSTTVSEAATEALSSFARAHRLTVGVLVQAAWSLLLREVGGSDTVIYGLTTSGRAGPVPGVERMLGLFINTLPVAVRFPRQLGTIEWLRALMAKQSAIVTRDFSPLSLVRRCAGLSGDVAPFDSVVVFENLEHGAVQRWRDVGLEVHGVVVRVNEGQPLVLVAQPGRRLGLQIKSDARAPGAIRAEAPLALAFLERALERLTAAQADEPLDGTIAALTEWLRGARSDARRARREALGDELHEAPR